jgi:hypothetical protein
MNNVDLEEIFKGKRVVHISDNDLDGVFAQVIFHNINTLADYYPYITTYKSFKDDVCSILEDVNKRGLSLDDVEIVISDINLSVELQAILQNLLGDKFKDIYVIDHHTELLKGQFKGIIDTSVSTTELIYNHIPRIHNEYLQVIVESVTSFDLAKVYDEERYKVGTILSALKSHLFLAPTYFKDGIEYHMYLITMMANAINDLRIDIYNDKKLDIQYKLNSLLIGDNDYTIDDLKKELYIKTFNYNKCLERIEIDHNGNKYIRLDNVIFFRSLANVILDKYPDVKYIIKVKDGIAFSSRDFDVSEIAREIGGDGHRLRSGAKCPKEFLNYKGNSLIRDIIKKQKGAVYEN